MMKPNCRGCQAELNMAYEYQSAGENIALENMGIKKHCFLCFPDDEEVDE